MIRSKISSNRLSTILFLLSAVILAFFVLEVRRAQIATNEQVHNEENRRICEQESQSLLNATNYLTGEVWHFTATLKKEHITNYWDEVSVEKSRERSLQKLEQLSLTDEEMQQVRKAKQESDELINSEAWTMRLVADSIGIEPDEMPEGLLAVTYENGEEKLTAAEKRKLASDYIFGEEYAKRKADIKEKLNVFLELVRDRKDTELAEFTRLIEESVNNVKAFVLALILMLVFQMLLQYFLIIRPFHFFAEDFGKMEGKGFTPLIPMGAKETRSFAKAFNGIYTQWTEQKSRLEQERFRFRVALENTSIIVYEYDTATDTYMAFGTLLENKNSGQANERVIPNFISGQARFLVGDKGTEQLQEMINGNLTGSVEMQIKSPVSAEEEIWVRISSTAVYDENGTVIKLIGKITNIQSEKEKEFALEDARNRDGLTGFYKRKPGMRRVREYMQHKPQEEMCSIMLLDMDDFERVNEEDGSIFADAVLQDVADILRENMGPDDIQVRVGGDEFLLFMKGTTSADVQKAGRKIAAQIKKLSGCQESGYRISASIGMCSTEAAGEYDGLYRYAESTLKYVKEHDKGNAACYLEASGKLDIPLTQLYPDGYLFNKIDRSENMNEDLPSFALNLLGKSRNLSDAVYLLLCRVGNLCHFDRIAITEVDMEYLSCRVIHQWAGNRANQMPVENQYAESEDIESLYKAYDSDGLCDKYVIPSPYTLGSILHAAIWNYGNYAGCMSFETLLPHQWTEEERSLLSELARIISSFTLKARADAVSQAKTDFLSRMSHEIRTPMNAITGMTTIAKTALDNPEKELDCLNKIEFANRHLMNLINDILDMSRIESGKVEINTAPVSLEMLIENIEMLIRPQAEAKNLEFSVVNKNTGARPVLADELHLNQVLVNLLSNAVKFTEDGGRVILSLEPAAEDGAGAAFRFSVKDTGIGINSEAQKRIFNAFEQAESNTVSNYGGTGLGLSISSRLVQMMGGSLEVNSVPGQGSDFFFTLYMPYAAEGEKKTAREKSDLSFNPYGKRLLLAEDNQLNREIAQEILTAHGFTIETAADGKAAVEQFGVHDPGYYDAILMDIRMPVMDGMEAARRIRRLGKADSRTVPIIAMTANAFDEDMKKSLEIGMNGHLSKPIEVEKLFKMLADVISAEEKQ